MLGVLNVATGDEGVARGVAAVDVRDGEGVGDADLADAGAVGAAVAATRSTGASPPHAATRLSAAENIRSRGRRERACALMTLSP